MKRTGNRRPVIVLVATMTAILGVVWRYPDSPACALLWIGAVLAVSSVAYPSPMWLRVRDFCCWIPWALADKRHKPAAVTDTPATPEDPEDAALRKRYELDLAEYDTRIQIGMPVGHPERLAYNLEGPTLALDRSERGRNAEQWDDLEAGPDLWPDGEWAGVIEEVRREQGWKP